jgi:hypothetical protein
VLRLAACETILQGVASGKWSMQQAEDEWKQVGQKAGLYHNLGR